ncbi:MULTISPECIES: AlbA family DNA-binding domain-containing protein [Rhizobium]|uniref:ATP-binding protein n=1 Tax=Rhizobium tropici TaxID=398 RepID=A0A6P1C4H2_RHITR|nr:MULTISPECIES: ATP-binding protein [Rhizobium]MBB4243656.1 putative HTH transcriptional regulator [Rhizobium tropici]MBB5595895.1 putative HTH transcriptional regulator [Rhizobium tropici]MBB6493888.1 putative HTH transcriptional regulator [Rhizobium tropici]NEV11326.1 ATP-binding protein [Rhizobium tropici]
MDTNIARSSEYLESESMFAREFDDIALSDLQALVEEGIPEGRQLEFKRDHYGRKDEDRREFAADVSAMANAVGGYLVIGLDERNGIASDVSGVATPDPDGLVRAVSDTIRTSFEPPILEFRVKWIAIEGERGVLVIKMARSWSAPPPSKPSPRTIAFSSATKTESIRCQ